MTSSPPVLVSAIVSTFNAARFMRGCIEDLEGQTISDKIEIIIVDSASEQNEGDIVREFQERYPNIRYIRTEQRESVYAAWNRGIRMAHGKYITNANTDDRHRTNAFARMSQVLEMRPEIALVYADVFKTETENETFEGRTETGRYRWHDWDRNLLLTQGCFMGPQPMWRRSVHDLYGYFDESLVTSGDYEFWLRISQTFRFPPYPGASRALPGQPGQHRTPQPRAEERGRCPDSISLPGGCFKRRDRPLLALGGTQANCMERLLQTK